MFAEDCPKVIKKYLPSIIEHLRDFSEIQKSLISKVIKLVNIVPALSGTNATSKRFFSMLRVVKSYLQLTTRQCRLNHLMLLTTYNTSTY